MFESQTSVELPVLDISQPLQPSAVSSFTKACKRRGFFLISNHGISRDLYRRLFQESFSTSLLMPSLNLVLHLLQILTLLTSLLLHSLRVSEFLDQTSLHLQRVLQMSSLTKQSTSEFR